MSNFSDRSLTINGEGEATKMENKIMTVTKLFVHLHLKKKKSMGN